MDPKRAGSSSFGLRCGSIDQSSYRQALLIGKRAALRDDAALEETRSFAAAQ